MIEPEGINTSTVGVIVGLGSLVVVVLVYFTQALFFSVESQIDTANRVGSAGAEVRSIEATQRESLNGYRWRDRDKGRVALPIARAMDLVVAEQAAAQASSVAAPPVSAHHERRVRKQ